MLSAAATVLASAVFVGRLVSDKKHNERLGTSSQARGLTQSCRPAHYIVHDVDTLQTKQSDVSHYS